MHNNTNYISVQILPYVLMHRNINYILVKALK